MSLFLNPSRDFNPVLVTIKGAIITLIEIKLGCSIFSKKMSLNKYEN